MGQDGWKASIFLMRENALIKLHERSKKHFFNDRNKNHLKHLNTDLYQNILL